MFKFINIFKIYLLFGIVGCFFYSSVFAANSDASTFGQIFVSIIDVLVSIWFIFPIIAGKLLTNDLIYGSVLHLDTLFWQIWNFSRSLANFTIGFMFIYFIFKFLVKVEQSDFSIIKNNLPKIAIGAIIINASWFIIGVLIDISTILIVGFGSLPLKFYNQDTKQQIDKIALPGEIILKQGACKKNPEAGVKSNCFDGSLQIDIKPGKKAQSLKDLQTYGANISGPLFFMGTSIIEINDKQNLINSAFNVNDGSLKSGGPAIKAFVKLIIAILFIVPLLILIVVNVVRVFRVWMYICFSPLIFLDQIFGGKASSKANQKAFGFKNMIGLIFQPALVVLMFSISTIFIMGLYDALKTSEGGDGYTQEVKKVFLLDNADNGILQTNLGTFEDTNSTGFVGGFFSYLIISAFIIFILWGMIKMSFQATAVTSGIANSAFDFTKNMAATVNFIPTPVGAVSLGSLDRLSGYAKSIPSNIASKQSDELTKAFGIDTSDMNKQTFDLIMGNLGSGNRKFLEDGVKDSLDELSKYKGQNVESYVNVKHVVDGVISYIDANNITIADLQNAKTYKDKIDAILSNKDKILPKS